MFKKLREEYGKCIYHGYTLTHTEDTLQVEYQIEIENLDTFSTRWYFPKSMIPFFKEDDPMARRLLYLLGMSEVISYYKLTCAPIVVVKESLNDFEKQWWNKLFYHGLGEFLYRNEISITQEELVSFEVQGEAYTPIISKEVMEGALIPIGGGKDSAVTIDLLKDTAMTKMVYMINTRGACDATADIGNYPQERRITPRRTLDKKILEYNKQGFLNGHIPFSAVVAFSAVFCAYCNHLQYVILSNEASANESSVKDSTVNHQYSKSLEFENDFREYMQSILCPVDYFSLLRPLSEYQIGKHFAKLQAFHPVFKSCNLGSKTDSWCCNCAKCLYVYVLLSAFLSKEELINIFGEDLLVREDLVETFYELIGLRDTKPFECVGAVDEINFAVIEAIKRYTELPLMYQLYTQTPLYQEYMSKENPYNTYYEEENNVPDRFATIVKKEMIEHV
ncbi:MAG: hypothetical protein IKL88_06520 [Erysipelotrichales bacterium]|nr:hypothetical protein [Erysipelotrichales bacterium]